EHPHIGVLLLFKDGSIYMNASFRERFKELKLY
ncbi:MAG: FAD:protein FMN transferase, partial [Aquificota bacterium]